MKKLLVSVWYRLLTLSQIILIKNIHINPIWANVHPYKQILIIPKEKDQFYAQLKDLKILYGTKL